MKPIYIIYLSNGLVHSDFCFSLVQMCMYATNRRVFLGVNKIECSEIEVGRALAVRTMFEQAPDATHLLFLDSDMIFPCDLLQRLLNRNRDIVGTTYCQRRSPRGFVHEPLSDGVIDSSIKPLRVESRGLYEIKSTGFGAILIRSEVFMNVPRPWFASTYTGKIDPVTGEDERRSEDRSFCDRARAKGYKVWCDFDLSSELKHIGQFPFGVEHVEMI